jgi:Raf kinase inhibitor-like YbhB/YbcL family protein
MNLAVLALVLSSARFAPNSAIPAAHTCEGSDRAPPLSWSGVPPQAKSLALVVEDPDAPDPKAPQMTWVHWVLYNLPPTATSLPEGVTSKTLPPGTREGLNDWKQPGWRGPCPPIGRHRYFFKLYALDIVMPEKAKLDEKQLLEAIKGHVLAEGQLIGTYEKQKR